MKNQIKKNYSLLAQIQQKVLFELGDNLVLGFGWEEFNNNVIANLKVIKKCEGNALEQNCLPKYKDLHTASGCPAFSTDSIYNNATVYIIADGEILIPYNNDWRSLWLVDVNGLKGPNKGGYDLFEVRLDLSSKKLEYLSNGCINRAEGGLDNFNNIDNW